MREPLDLPTDRLSPTDAGECTRFILPLLKCITPAVKLLLSRQPEFLGCSDRSRRKKPTLHEAQIERNVLGRAERFERSADPNVGEPCFAKHTF